jgi:hypothetical protein
MGWGTAEPGKAMTRLGFDGGSETPSGDEERIILEENIRQTI